MIAVARRNANSKIASNPAVVTVLRRLLSEPINYPEMMARFQAETGLTISLVTLNRYARRWGLQRFGRHQADDHARDVLRGLLADGAPIDRARRSLLEMTGVQLSRKVVTRFRREWGIRAHKGGAMRTPKECGLCGQDTHGKLYDGARWDIEGNICGPCKVELTAEALAAYRKQQRELAEVARRERIRAADAVVLAAAKRRSANDRRREALAESRRVEHVARAKAERAEGLRLLSGTDPRLPVACCDECRFRGHHFTADDLRGRAVTHWLKETLATDATALLMAG